MLLRLRQSTYNKIFDQSSKPANAYPEKTPSIEFEALERSGAFLSLQESITFIFLHTSTPSIDRLNDCDNMKLKIMELTSDRRKYLQSSNCKSLWNRRGNGS